MQVTVEAPSNIERRLTISVPAERLDQAFDQEIAKLVKTAKVDGFRRGKVPLQFIKQRYGDAARQEALSQLIQTAFNQALVDEKLNPVGTPHVEPKNITPGQPIEFTATFEVVPQLETVHFQLPSLEKQTAELTDKDVDAVIERMRAQHATWQAVTRPAQDKDRVVIDFSGAIDGVAFEGGKADNYPIVLGSHSMIPGFEEGIQGLSAGETKVVPIKFPDDYFAKEVAGKVADFTLHAKKVLQPEYPAIDENFAKKLGIKSGSVEDLTREIRVNLNNELQRVIKAKTKSAVFDALLAQNPLDVPHALIQQEAKHLHDQMHPSHQGHEHHHTAEEEAQFLVLAKRNIILGLIMSVLLKQYKITADDAQIKAHIEQQCAAYENVPEMVKWYYQNKQALAEAKMQVLEDQLIEKLLESVQVTEKMVTYNELMKQ